MKIDLVLTFTSADRPGIVEDLTTTVVQHGGNWEESRLARLCGDFAGIARVTIDKERSEELEKALADLGSKGLEVHCKSAASSDRAQATQEAQLMCSGADHEGIVSSLAAKLATLSINVEEMETSIVPAPTTGTPLFNMTCRIKLPEACDLNELQSDLNVLGDELGVEVQLT